MRVRCITFAAMLAVMAVPLFARGEWVTTKHATVQFIEDARVPAQEEGVIRELFVRDGQLKKQGDVLAQIDDRLVALQLDVARAELAVAKRRAEDTISIEYAQKAAKVHLKDYQRLRDAEARLGGTVPQADLDLALLKYEQYVLQAQKSEFERGNAELEMKVSEAKMNAANEHIERSKIRAPWEGVVDRVVRFTGDWVKPGDPILHMIRMDRLRVSCEVDATKYSPQNINGQPVVVRVTVPGGGTETFHGRVDGFDPAIDGMNNTFHAWTELTNRKKGGYWVLRPGLWADEMAIDVKPAPLGAR